MDMSATPDPADVLRQHLIDPEICIRCNTCEETCPLDAITHDSRNYVVDPAICNACNACISPCPTGAIDSWRQIARASAYSLSEQLTWDVLPAQQEVAAGAAGEIPQEIARITAEASAGQGGAAAPPWSAAHPYVNLHTLAKPAVATVRFNACLRVRCNMSVSIPGSLLMKPALTLPPNALQTAFDRSNDILPDDSRLGGSRCPYPTAECRITRRRCIGRLMPVQCRIQVSRVSVSI